MVHKKYIMSILLLHKMQKWLRYSHSITIQLCGYRCMRNCYLRTSHHWYESHGNQHSDRSNHLKSIIKNFHSFLLYFRAEYLDMKMVFYLTKTNQMLNLCYVGRNFVKFSTYLYNICLICILKLPHKKVYITHQ